MRRGSGRDFSHFSNRSAAAFSAAAGVSAGGADLLVPGNDGRSGRRGDRRGAGGHVPDAAAAALFYAKPGRGGAAYGVPGGLPAAGVDGAEAGAAAGAAG